jgi:hypothetical protein
MSTDAASISRIVLAEISDFRAPGPQPDQLGLPLPPEWFHRGLREMKRALVPPVEQEVLDYDTSPGSVLTRRVWVVADDGEGTLLVYDPHPEGDFALVWRHADQHALSNIRGDAVGCFLSR